MLFDRPEAGRRTLLLQVELRKADNPDGDELAELARSADLIVVDTVVARREAPDSRWFVGSGKVQEIKAQLAYTDAEILLTNHDLSPGQQRNLEQELDCRLITRTELILTIFAERARSHEGQLQVELAQLKHAQTRLVRGWTHLDRQKGGIGLRGAGEKQIELDQRMLAERLKATEQKLSDVAKRREQNRRGRNRRGTPTVSLVGYTNAGKSTLFRMIAGTEQPDSGTITLGETVKVAYVEQSRDSLDDNHNVWEAISGGHDMLKIGNYEVSSRAYAGRFNFRGSDQQKRVGELSGGERGRLHLANTLKQGANVLLLDEPSNDLDIETLRALEEAVLSFPGCVMVISHDRWFLDRIATHILAYEGDSEIQFFEGGYSEYHQDFIRRKGTDAQPTRVKYKRLKA